MIQTRTKQRRRSDSKTRRIHLPDTTALDGDTLEDLFASD
jgi:hypothetical protein